MSKTGNTKSANYNFCSYSTNPPNIIPANKYFRLYRMFIKTAVGSLYNHMQTNACVMRDLKH